MPDHDTDQPAEMRSGFVALAGRPNVGKSSLTNAIVGQKVTIVSPRPQTTRHEIRGMLTRADAQLVLVDTPGVHKPKTAMGKRLNRTATEAREDTDATVLVVDASKGVGGPGDARLMAAMPDDVIVAINKIDRLPQEQVLAAIKNAAALAKRFEKGAVEIFPISARTNKGVPELTEYLIGLLPPGPLWYPEDQVRDSTEGFWVAELGILLVCDADENLLGVITSRDIDSERASRIIAKAGCAREDLLVSDVMTLRPKLEVLMMEDVLGSRVGDIIATLRQVNRQHALVLDIDPETDIPAIRGIFSLAEIGLRMGLSINPARQPTTYAELEKAGAAL